MTGPSPLPRSTALLLLGLSLTWPLAAQEAEAPGVISVSELQPGQQGYGLSVFSGAAPERFEVEVLGVMRNVSPETSYILARLSGQDLERSGVVAGMSGSPVYVDGRLAGAVAFAWPFSKDAVAGITPIGSMRQLLGVAASSGQARAGRAPEPADVLRPPTEPEALTAALARLRPRLPGQGSSGLQWAASGFGELSRGLLQEGLGRVLPAGEATGRIPELVPGSAVAGVLVDGDLRIAATGTVTDRVGSSVLAFGHTFLGMGPVRIPMAGAEVVTVLANELSSFKISNFGEIVGAFDLDRMAGIRGQLGLKAPMVPLQVRLRGVGEEEYSMRVAELPQLTPLLLAMSLLGAIDATTELGGDQGLDLVASFQTAEHGELTLEQSFDGSGATVAAALYVLTVANYLLENRLDQAELQRVTLEVTQYPASRTAVLVGAHASRTEVRPGDRVALNLDFVAFRGEPFRRTVEVDIPTGLPDGRYSLLVGDGPSLDAARLAIEQAAPVSFQQALELLRSFHSRRELVVLGVFDGPGLAVAGEVLPRLPGSMRSLWEAAASGSAVPLRLAVAQEQSEVLAMPIQGAVRIDLTMKRAEPLGGEKEEQDGEPSGAEVAGEGGGAEPGSEAVPRAGSPGKESQRP